MDSILLWLKDYGIIGGFLFGVVAFIFDFFCRKINNLAKKIEDSTGKVTNIHVALSDEKGQPIVQHDILKGVIVETKRIEHKLDEHDAASQEHFKDVARLADENKVRDCDVTKCLHINLVTKSLENVIDRLNQFDEAAKENRGNTLSSIDSLRSQMTDLTRDILATLRVFKGGNE